MRRNGSLCQIPLLSRRRLLVASVATAGDTLPASAALNTADWVSFKSRFLSADGRITDNGNGGVSHSEGQGWGLLFASAFRDEESFNRIFSWTRRHLRRPNDNLHSWRFVPSDQPSVRDLNNATDGDIFIGAALARAGRLWQRPDHLAAAADIARDILSRLVRRVGSHLVLLPGVTGFEADDGVIINPSYYAFPMIAELAKLVPSPTWAQLQRDGHALIEQGRFGQWGLPPDWLRIALPTMILSPAPGWPPRFSFDAIRIPLWHTWHRLPAGLMQRSVIQFWATFPPRAIPAWADLVTNQTAEYPITPGILAVMQLTRASLVPGTQPVFPPVADGRTYYDAALILLSRITWQEIAMTRQP